MLDFVDAIKDPIWGYIPITDIEKKIINTSVFKRLRGVRQMSLAYVSFSGANHTRFEHSIGTMHVAYTMATSIRRSLVKPEKLDYDNAMQFLRISALLHDLAHPPFSHAIENVFLKNPDLISMKDYTHDKYTEELIQNNEEIKDIIEKDTSFSLEKIAQLATGDESGYIKEKQRGIDYTQYKIFFPIISGDIDADKIDYILRDNYHCGVPSGLDIGAICDALTMGEDGAKILLKPDKLTPVETLLTDRLRLIKDIHHDVGNRIANQMLMRAVAGYLKTKDKDRRDTTVKNMHEIWTDYDMYGHLFGISEEKTGDLESWKTWADRVFKADLLSEIKKLQIVELHPDVRMAAFIVNQNHEHILSIQERLEGEDKLNTKVLLDFCFINPPPLTLRLDEGRPENRPFLFDKSQIIKGVLQDSFNKSFVALYANKEDTNVNIYFILCEEIITEAKIIRDECFSKNEILGCDLILTVLKGIKKFEDGCGINTSLWVYSTIGLQKFLGSVMESCKINCPNLESIDSNSSFNISFFHEIEKLFCCGLLEQRKKTVSRPGGYSIRFDHRLNSYGNGYLVKSLSNHDIYDNVVEYVYNKESEKSDLIMKCIQIDRQADKSTKEGYKKFVEEIKPISDKIRNEYACILTT